MALKSDEIGKHAAVAVKKPFEKAPGLTEGKQGSLNQTAADERNWKSRFTAKFCAIYEEKAKVLRTKRDYDDLQGGPFEKHVARVTVVAVARAIFSSRGFEEVELNYSEPGNKQSNIILTIDTIDAGKYEIIVPKQLSVIFNLNIPPHDMAESFVRELKEIASVFEREYGIPIHFLLVGRERSNIDIVPPPLPPAASEASIYAIVPAIGIPPSGKIIAYCETADAATTVLSTVSKGESIQDQFIPTDLRKVTGYYIVRYHDYLGAVLGVHEAEVKRDYGSPQNELLMAMQR